jgi:hypothetical protein
MATAPLRKCIARVAGTPVVEVPSALVTTGFPFTVTLTMTAFRASAFMAFRAMATIAAPSLLGVAADAAGATGDAYSVPSTSARRATPTPTGRQHRLRWFDEALRPLEGLPAKQRKRIRAALALSMGIEPIVVMQDACQLDDREALAVLHWVATALLRAASDETCDYQLMGDDPTPPMS